MKKHDLTNTHLHRASPGKALYAAFVGATMTAMLCQPVFAATVWEKANEIMKDVYNQILLISTIAAIVTASVALLLMNFSRPHRGRKPRMAQAYHHHLGDSQRSGLHHVLCNALLHGWQMERITLHCPAEKGVVLWAY